MKRIKIPYRNNFMKSFYSYNNIKLFSDKVSDAVTSKTVKLSASYDPSSERKMTSLELQHLRRKGSKIAMLTAYDYPTVIIIKMMLIYITYNLIIL